MKYHATVAVRTQTGYYYTETPQEITVEDEGNTNVGKLSDGTEVKFTAWGWTLDATNAKGETQK